MAHHGMLTVMCVPMNGTYKMRMVVSRGMLEKAGSEGTTHMGERGRFNYCQDAAY